MGSMNLVKLFNIKENVENCEKVPFTNKCIVNKNEQLQRLEEVIRLRKGETNE